MLAQEAARRPDLEVIESDAGDRDPALHALRDAGRRLRPADVVHVQWRSADWGLRTGGLARLAVLRGAIGRPLVVTLHDVFPRRGLRARWLEPGALGLRALGRMAARLVVHSQEERGRLAGLVPARLVEVVPHFVEERPSLPEREAARAGLGVADRRVITLLGAITKRRGHRLVIEALPSLPDDVVALFVGTNIEGRDHVTEATREHAAAVGVRARVRFTGYVPDEELERILVATDVGLCPFRDMSASGALASWISVARPIVTSDLPAIRELDALVPGALRRFSPYEPGALATAISRALVELDGPEDPGVRDLAERLSTPRIVERYVDIYRSAGIASSAS
jgi:glycosyltransferase involved in cell wall biosynthesis